MKTIYTFEQRLMNGTVTASSGISAFADKELAERARATFIRLNRERRSELSPLVYYCGEIQEASVFETEEEVLEVINS